MTAKTRSYYVELGRSDAQAGNPSNNTFKAGSWQGFAYDEGFNAERREAVAASQAVAQANEAKLCVYPQLAQEQPSAAQVAPLVKSKQSPYLQRLKAERVRLYTRHGFKYEHGEDGGQWSTDRLLRPQVIKRLAHLEGLIQLAMYGRQDCRPYRRMDAKAISRSYGYSMTWYRKDGVYGPSLLRPKPNKPLVMVNGVEMNHLHPVTFTIPTIAEKQAVKPEQFVKISVETGIPDEAECERFWVKVTRNDTVNQVISGTVCNDLMYTDGHGLMYRAPVKVPYNAILDIDG